MQNSGNDVCSSNGFGWGRISATYLRNLCRSAEAWSRSCWDLASACHGNNEDRDVWSEDQRMLQLLCTVSAWNCVRSWTMCNRKHMWSAVCSVRTFQLHLVAHLASNMSLSSSILNLGIQLRFWRSNFVVISDGLFCSVLELCLWLACVSDTARNWTSAPAVHL